MIYCYKKDCIYRSKRKSKAVNNVGEPMYKCLCKDVVIGIEYKEDTELDEDGEYTDVTKLVPTCISYKEVE